MCIRDSPAAVDCAHRIEQLQARVALEGGETVADLDEPERQRLRNRRLRQAAIDDGLQHFLAAHTGNFLGIGRTMVAGRHVSSSV